MAGRENDGRRHQRPGAGAPSSLVSAGDQAEPGTRQGPFVTVEARVAADEAEVLTLAVAPAARRQGLGAALLETALLAAAAAGAGAMFLEVSTGNAAARASLGDVFQGDGGRIGASMLMERVFTLAGWQGPAYLQTLRALQTHTPFVNRQYYLNRGRLTGVGEGEPAWLTQARTLDYYLRHSAPVMP